ncbi:hypothetical protein AAVH_23121 [Aphelenchoides avenae]|nr:hypothetical protein AAVH_23121 [Aphelenchus avenae]
MDELHFIPSSKLNQQQAVTKHPTSLGKVYTRRSTRKKQKRFHTGLKRLADLTQEDYPDLWQTLRGISSPVDSRFHGEQLIIFADAEAVVMASPRQLEWLRSTQLIVCDGSFKFTEIFGFVSETHCVPLVTAVLTGKSEEIYEKMWAAVANALPEYLFDIALFQSESETQDDPSEERSADSDLFD